jgi:hypothetical protein
MVARFRDRTGLDGLKYCVRLLAAEVAGIVGSKLIMRREKIRYEREAKQVRY